MNQTQVGGVCKQESEYGFLIGPPSHPGPKQRKLRTPRFDGKIIVRGSPDGSVAVTTLPRRSTPHSMAITTLPRRSGPHCNDTVSAIVI